MRTVGHVTAVVTCIPGDGGGERADDRPDERALALLVDPRVVVVGDPQAVEAGVLGQPRLLDELAAGRTPRRTGSIRCACVGATREHRRTRLLGPMADLQERTRWEPAEAEARIFARWLESGLFHPEPARHRRGELLDRGPAAERHGRAAHGPRAERLGPGHADPLQPDARQAHEVDARHRPRRDRHAAPGREAARQRGDEPRGARPRGVHRARLAVARAVRRHDHRPVPAARRVARLRRGALHARPRATCARS